LDFIIVSHKMRELCGILVVAFTLRSVIFSSALDSSKTDVIHSDRVSIYIMMLPEVSVENLRSRFRQDEAEAVASGVSSFVQTSQNIGQILSGILGGDVRPIFAGSVRFVGNQNVASGLNSFLNSIAPAVNLALREMYTRTQAALGFAPTTPEPLSQNMTGAGSNLTAYGGNGAQQQLQTPAPTTAWEYILNQIKEGTTTVEPLPFIKFNKPGLNEDDDGKRSI